jgi:hypothetical protein
MLWYSPPQVVIYSFGIFLLLLFSTLGAGFVFFRPHRFEDWITTWSVGSAVFLAVLLFIALWHPISGRFSLVLAISSLALCWLAVVRFMPFAKPAIIKVIAEKQLTFILIPILLGTACIIFAVIRRSIFPIDSYDTWLYHWPMADWLRYGPIPWGWSWLHIRFGFFDAGFLLTSWLAGLLPANSVISAVNAYWMIILTLMSFYGCYRLWKKPKETEWLWLGSGLPIAVVSSSTLLAAHNMAPEFGVFLFGWLAIFFALQKKFSVGLILVALAISIKISAIFLLPIMIVMWTYKVHQRQEVPWMGLGSFLLYLLLWVLATIKSTGYLLFPIWFTKLPLSYALPIKTIRALQATIYYFARFNPYDPHFDNFLPWFWQVFIPSLPILYTFLLLLMMMGFVVILFHRKELFRPSIKYIMIIAALLWGMLIVQFWSAPDERLLWPTIAWIASTTLLLWHQILIKRIHLIKNVIVLYIWGSTVGTIFYFSPYLHKFSWSDLTTRPAESFHSDLPYQQAVGIPFTFTTPPAGSDQCGMAPYPCLLNASQAATLRFTINKKGWVTKIVPGDNVPEMP